jgi:hypothetical protein
VKEDSAIERYALLGRQLYGATGKLPKGQRQAMIKERQQLLRDFGPSIRRPGSRTAASRGHITLFKPKHQEGFEATGTLAAGHVVVLLLDHSGEVVFRHDLSVGNIWRGRKHSLSPDGRQRVSRVLRALAAKIAPP